MKQVVARKSLSTLQGIGLILALVAVLVLLNHVVLNLLAAWLGAAAASIGFWLIGGAIALWVLRVFVVKYSYEVGPDVLRLCRSYGKRERHIEDVYLNQILFVGAPEAAKKRWPDAKRVRAMRSPRELPVTAVVYKTAFGKRVALIQANDELKSHLADSVR